MSTGEVDEEFDVPSGTLSAPIAKLLYRLCAPLRMFHGSRAQLVAAEIYRFPLRISAAASNRSLLTRAYVAPDFLGCTPATFYEECTYLVENNSRTLRLLREHRWAGPLDHRIAIEAFGLGAEYILSSRCIRRPDETQVPGKSGQS